MSPSVCYLSQQKWGRASSCIWLQWSYFCCSLAQCHTHTHLLILSQRLTFNLVWVNLKAAGWCVIVSFHSVIVIERGCSVRVSKLLVGFSIFCQFYEFSNLQGKNEDKQGSRELQKTIRMKSITIKRRYYIIDNFLLLRLWLLLVGWCHFFLFAFLNLRPGKNKRSRKSIKRRMKKI